MSVVRRWIVLGMIPTALGIVAAPALADSPFHVEYEFPTETMGASPGPVIGYHTPGQPLTWALYGTTAAGGGGSCLHGCGLVFKLTPPPPGSSGPWTETVLHVLHGDDGAGPTAALTIAPSGVIYGAATNGGSHSLGTIFKLDPPTAGNPAWVATVLHNFAGGADGALPVSAMILDASGALYGTAPQGTPGVAGGTVFKLAPPATGAGEWTYSVLHAFPFPQDYTPGGYSPAGGLVMDAAGVLYGTAEGGGSAQCQCGLVYRLTPPARPGTAWKYDILYSFAGDSGQNPDSTLLRDASGALYGETLNGKDLGGGVLQGTGTVFRLAPPPQGGTAWTETTLHSFTSDDGGSPQGGLIAVGGSLYGTGYMVDNYSFGRVFRLTPPASGQGPWTETVLHDFDVNDLDIGLVGPLGTDASGNLYASGPSPRGSGYGAITKIYP